MRRGGIVAAFAAALLACSLAPFEPRVAGDADGGDPRDAATVDARVPDGAMTGREGDCTNGRDDDGDGAIDCADPDCVDFVCVPDPPDGFEGPAWQRDTDCADAGERTLIEGGRGLRADAVSCDACTCGPPTNQRCTATVTGWSTSDCTGTAQTVTVPGDSSCASTSSTLAGASNVTARAIADCAVTSPSPPAITARPEPTFAERGWVCWGGAGGGCGAGMRCAAPPPAGAPRCVTREGDVDCPAELPSRRVLVTTIDDRRVCSDCSCGDFGGSCSGSLATFTNTSCTISSASSIGFGSACQSLSNARGFRYDGTASGVECRASGGTAQGCAAAEAVSTVCCEATAGPVCPVGRGPAMVHVAIPAGGTARSFCIDSTEVTNAQYAEFLAAAVDPSTQPEPCQADSTFAPRSWPAPADEASRPVVGVDWCDARAYCEWAGKRLCALTDGTTEGRRSDERDPARSEWTYACTAGGTLAPRCDDAVGDVRARPCCRLDGVWDLPGNAAEWTGTCEGGWSVFNNDCMIHRDDDCDSVDDRDPRDDDEDLGFRCCADPL